MAWGKQKMKNPQILYEQTVTSIWLYFSFASKKSILIYLELPLVQFLP